MLVLSFEKFKYLSNASHWVQIQFSLININITLIQYESLDSDTFQSNININNLNVHSVNDYFDNFKIN